MRTNTASASVRHPATNVVSIVAWHELMPKLREGYTVTTLQFGGAVHADVSASLNAETGKWEVSDNVSGIMWTEQ